MDANPIRERGEDRGGGIFGREGLLPFNTEAETPAVEGGGGVGVNGFLWRASLDTIPFMPVNSADPPAAAASSPTGTRRREPGCG